MTELRVETKTAADGSPAVPCRSGSVGGHVSAIGSTVLMSQRSFPCKSGIQPPRGSSAVKSKLARQDISARSLEDKVAKQNANCVVRRKTGNAQLAAQPPTQNYRLRVKVLCS
jgi:hypothetical protein